VNRDLIIGLLVGALAVLGLALLEIVPTRSSPFTVPSQPPALVACDLSWLRVQLDARAVMGRIVEVQEVAEFMERYNAEPPTSGYTGRPFVVQMLGVIFVAVVDEGGCVESMMNVDPKKLDYLLRGSNT
jgi:hypothetical protein